MQRRAWTSALVRARVSPYLLRGLGLVILLAGWALRVTGLGSDSLWNDEAGQAIAAAQPTIQETLAVANSHVAAMPLDYIVSHLIIRISPQEYVLRFPAVIWGILTCAILYRFASMRVGRAAALVGLLLLALSPVHVRYSQEMRFYAALVFFYWLSITLLFDCLDAPRDKGRWGLYVLVTGIGLYFHAYVLLTPLVGIVYLLIARALRRGGDDGSRQSRQAFWPLLLSTGLLFVIFVPWYASTGQHQKFDHPLLLWGSSLWELVASGLGWSITHHKTSATATVGVGEAALLTLFLLGVWSALKKRDALLLTLIVSMVLQIVLVLALDVIRGYWFASRQILFLLPLSGLISGVGFAQVSDRVRERAALRQNGSGWKKGLAFLIPLSLVGLLCVSRIPPLRTFYQWPRSAGREIAYILAQEGQQKDLVWVLPSYESKIYSFYLQFHLAEPKDPQPKPLALQGTSWEALETDLRAEEHANRRVWIIVPFPIAPDQRAFLASQGFLVRYEPPPDQWGRPDWWGLRALFSRPAKGSG